MKPGETRVREVIQIQKQRTRREDPRPYDNDWGRWGEAHIAKLKTGQLWLIRIAAGALVAELIRIGCQTFGLGGDGSDVRAGDIPLDPLKEPSYAEVGAG